MVSSPDRPVEARESRFQRRLVAFSLASAIVVCLLCFWPLLVGRHFLYADLGNFHLPLRLFYAEGLHDGGIPLWLPNLFCGFFLHAEGQVGMFHPIHLAFYGLLPLGVAFALECTLAYPAAFVGMALFLRRLRLPPAAAVCGATAFGFSTFLLVRYTHVNVVAILAHVPWLLLLVDIAARTRRGEIRRRCWAGVALLTASQVLLGYPGALVFSLAYVGLYALHLTRECRDPNPIVWLVAASALGILIGAVQWLPTFELFAASNRFEASVETRFAQSLHPWNLLLPFAPYLFHQRVFQVGPPNPVEQAFYLGAAFPIAVTWLVVRRRALGRSRALLVALAVVCGVSILLALGRYGGVLQLVSGLPLVGQLRVPARFTLILNFAAAIAIGLAFADLLGSSPASDGPGRRAARWLWLAPALSLVIAVGALAVGASPLAPTGSGRELAGARAILIGPVLSLLCASIWFAAARGRRAALAFLALFVGLDQAAYAASLWWTVPPASVEDYLASVPRPSGGRPGRVALGFSDAARVDREGRVFFEASTRYIVHGDRLVWGYAGLLPRRRVRPYSPNALAAAGVGVLHRDGSRVVFDDPLPRFRLVSSAHVGDDPRREVADLDVRTTAFVEAPVALEPGPAGSVRLLEERSGEIRLAVQAPTRQLLVIAESHHAGWQLTIDGDPAPILRVYGDFMGATIAPGEHRVALDFRPQSVSYGLALSLAGLLLLGMGYWAAGRHPPSNRSDASQY